MFLGWEARKKPSSHSLIEPFRRLKSRRLEKVPGIDF
jgi:hypothetical protein